MQFNLIIFCPENVRWTKTNEQHENDVKEQKTEKNSHFRCTSNYDSSMSEIAINSILRCSLSRCCVSLHLHLVAPLMVLVLQKPMWRRMLIIESLSNGCPPYQNASRMMTANGWCAHSKTVPGIMPNLKSFSEWYVARSRKKTHSRNCINAHFRIGFAATTTLHLICLPLSICHFFSWLDEAMLCAALIVDGALEGTAWLLNIAFNSFSFSAGFIAIS